MQLAALTSAHRTAARPLDLVVGTPLVLARPGSNGNAFVDGASGLAVVNGAAWVASDTSAHLARFDAWGTPGAQQRGLPERDKRYDLESITVLGRDAATGNAQLLAIGSGSKKDRAIGLLQTVDAAGAATGATSVDLAPLFKAMREASGADINIEGSAVRQGRDGAELLLFHRAQLGSEPNRVFVVDAAAVAHAAHAGKPVPASALTSTQAIQLGALPDGSILGFSDARALADGRILFTASAESGDPLNNGAIAGSAIGILDANFGVTQVTPFAGRPRKVEGVALARDLDPSAPADRVLLVTDPDDDLAAGERLSVDLGTPLS